MTEAETSKSSLAVYNRELYLQKCISFLNEIGIETRFEKLEETCFLPGLSIRNGVLIIDREGLQYTGDILHEAGHIAVVPLAERETLTASAIATRAMHEAEEMMAIAWSYAACVHLELDPGFVFHDEGYQGGGSHLAETFTNGGYIGLPVLQWKGMALEQKNAAAQDLPAYPCMIKWTLD